MIEQLQSAGVEDIYIVIGFMKEKFFCLEAKYGVKSVNNNSFATKGNLYLLYKAKEFVNNTGICCVINILPIIHFIEETEYVWWDMFLTKDFQRNLLNLWKKKSKILELQNFF